MLNQIIEYLKNYFQDNDYCYQIDCTFNAGANTITGDFEDTFFAGEYIRIKDSRLNDGVYLISSIDDTTITIDATVDLLISDEPEISVYVIKAKLPPDFLSLVSDIASWETSNSGLEGIKSESIDGYSVSFSDNSASGGWQGAFTGRLSKYRKMRW